MSRWVLRGVLVASGVLTGCVGAVKSVIPLSGYSRVDLNELNASRADLLAQIRVRVDPNSKESTCQRPAPLALEHAIAKLLTEASVEFDDEGKLTSKVDVTYEDEDGLVLTVLTLGICHLIDTTVTFGPGDVEFARALRRARAAGARVEKNPPRGLRLRIWGNSVKMTYASQRFRDEDVNRVVDATQPFLPGLDQHLLIGEPSAVADRFDESIASVTDGLRGVSSLPWGEERREEVAAAIAAMTSGVHGMAAARLEESPAGRARRAAEGVATVRSGVVTALAVRVGAAELTADHQGSLDASIARVESGLVAYLREFVRPPEGRNVVVFSSNPSEVLGALDTAIRGAQQGDEAERMLRDIASSKLAQQEADSLELREQLRLALDLLGFIRSELHQGSNPGRANVLTNPDREVLLARVRALRQLLEGGVR